MAPTSASTLLNLLFADKEAESAIAASDPYSPLKEVPDLVGKVLLQQSANQDFSTQDKILAGLLTGLVGGGIQGVSNDYRLRAKNAYEDVLQGQLAQTYGAGPSDMTEQIQTPMQKPSVLSPELYDMARGKAKIWELTKDAAVKEAANKSRADLEKTLTNRFINAKTPEEQQRAAELLKTYRQTGMVDINQVGDAEGDGKSLNEKMLKVMGETGRNQLAETTGVLSLMDEVAGNLSGLKNDTALGYQLGSLLTRTESGQVKQQLRMVSRLITRAIEGARPTDYDAETYRKMIEGDYSMSPGKIVNLIRQAQELFAIKQKGTLQGYEKMAGEGSFYEGLDKYVTRSEGAEGTKPQEGTPAVEPRKPGESINDYIARTR